MEWAGSEGRQRTLGHQQVDVVAADEVVRQADDGALQAGLPVVVRRVRAHKARQLRHLRTQHREPSPGCTGSCSLDSQYARHLHGKTVPRMLCSSSQHAACNFACRCLRLHTVPALIAELCYWSTCVGDKHLAHSALTSLRMLRLKQQNRILRWPGFRPSTMEGMERSRSARENRISSCAQSAQQG